jgi:hypothetical protein
MNISETNLKQVSRPDPGKRCGFRNSRETYLLNGFRIGLSLDQKVDGTVCFRCWSPFLNR